MILQANPNPITNPCKSVPAIECLPARRVETERVEAAGSDADFQPAPDLD